MKYKSVYCKKDYLFSFEDIPFKFIKGEKYVVIPCNKGPKILSKHDVMGESERGVIVIHSNSKQILVSPVFTMAEFYDIFEYGGKIIRFLRKIKDKLFTCIIIDLYKKRCFLNFDNHMHNEIVIEYRKNIVHYKVYSFANKVIRLGTYRKEKYIFGGK